jgi:RNA recognition motif-containing protein
MFMGKRLFVGSLPYDVTEDQLHSLFSPFGQVVSAKLIIDRDSGQSKGFGFVEMSTDSEASAAMQKLNGSPVGSRTIVVNEARPMENRGGGGGGGGYGGGRGGDRGGRGGGGNRW